MKIPEIEPNNAIFDELETFADAINNNDKEPAVSLESGTEALKGRLTNHCFILNLKEMKNIAVIGAGTMGNGIAHVFAQNGYPVNLVDISDASLEKGEWPPLPKIWTVW